MADIAIDKNVPVPMRDGVTLFADVYRPGAGGQRSVLLQRTAYDKAGAWNMLNPLRAVEDGYVAVIQDCRGRYTSEGKFVPFVDETNDGYDTVEWCAAQDWSNGKVGMYGMSYVGATQWLAAIDAPPSLRAIFPGMTAANYHDGWIYQGGALYLSFAAAWVVQFLAIPQLARLGLPPEERRAEEARVLGQIERLRRTLSHVPLRDLPMLSRPGLASYWRDWIDHPAYDAFWETIDITAHHDRVSVPAFNLGGWYDLFLAGPSRNFAGVRERGATEAARTGSRLLVGPWTHNNPSIAQVGEVNFGFGATLNVEDLQLRWFARWLKDEDNGVDREPPVRIYVINEGWRDEQEWPLARTEYTSFFIHSGGRAQSLEGDGRLSREQPVNEPPDVFLSNPVNPAPTIGAAGIADQRVVERRTDVLVYSSAPLAEPLEVTGPVRVVLWASSSAPDTDFTAKLVDVTPSGHARNVCEGILRARYRASHAQPELLEPGVPTQMEIDLLVTSTLFPVGHQIRLEIAGSNFPRFDRNPNTGEFAGTATTFCPALQTVYHDGDHPTHVLLPVIPRGRSTGPGCGV